MRTRDLHDGRARHAAGRGKPGTHHEQGGAAPAVAAPPLLPSGWTMAASVALGMLLAAGASCALRGTVEHQGVEAGRPPAFEVLALQSQVASLEAALYRAELEACPNLGVVTVPPPTRRPKPSVATQLQERAPEERVGSGQVDTESAAQDGSGVRTTDGARPVSAEVIE